MFSMVYRFNKLFIHQPLSCECPSNVTGCCFQNSCTTHYLSMQIFSKENLLKSINTNNLKIYAIIVNTLNQLGNKLKINVTV